MMIVKAPGGRDWYKANWAFRQLAQDVSLQFADDIEVCGALEAAQAIGLLDLKEMAFELRQRTVEAITVIIDSTIRGEIAGWRREDEDGRSMYLEALTELATLLRPADLN